MQPHSAWVAGHSRAVSKSPRDCDKDMYCHQYYSTSSLFSSKLYWSGPAWVISSELVHSEKDGEGVDRRTGTLLESVRRALYLYTRSRPHYSIIRLPPRGPCKEQHYQHTSATHPNEIKSQLNQIIFQLQSMAKVKNPLLYARLLQKMLRYSVSQTGRESCIEQHRTSPALLRHPLPVLASVHR